MKRFLFVALIITLMAFFKSGSIKVDAMTQEDIVKRMDNLYFFDINQERSEKYPQTAIPVKGYTDKEVEMICSVVMRETGYGDVLSKQLVTNVIRNRVRSDKFPNTVEEVLTAQDQFPTIVNWYTKEWPVTPETRIAVCYTLMNDSVDVSNGAVYFYATYLSDPSIVTWFEQQTFCIEHYGQRYFK